MALTARCSSAMKRGRHFAYGIPLATDKLSSVTQLAGGWQELADLSPQPASWAENEVSLGEELWLFHAVRLPWTSFAEAGALLLIAEDITARRQRDQARSEALEFCHARAAHSAHLHSGFF